MVKNEFTYPSRDGKTPIHAVIWRPDGEVRAVLQISHGVAEYALRYEPFAAFLTEHGFAVAANDHIGHGQSLAEGAPRLYFGPKGSWQTVVDDLYTLRCHCGKEFPGVPYALLGHSMGSFLARTYLIRYPGTVQAAVIMGTGQQSAAMTAGGRLVAARETRRLGGDDKVSKLAEGLAFGSYNKLFAPNRTSCDWLSLDTENVDRYLADPLCGGYATLGLFREMLSGLDFIRDPKNLAKMNANTPVFFVAGEMDPVGDCGRGVWKAAQSFRRAGLRDVTVTIYPEARHEILNDFCREQVQADILTWLRDRLKLAAPEA